MRPFRTSDSVDRRTFLGLLAAGMGSVGVLGCAGTPGADGSRTSRPLGVQLYTVRNLMERDVPETLRAVAAAGYEEVETAGFFGLAPSEFRALLDVHGLVSPAGHYPIDALRDDASAVLATAAAVGQRWVIVPWLPESERTARGYHRVAADLNRLGGIAQAEGIRIGYHNHEFEFDELERDRSGFEILLAETDPELVDFELDLFWASDAGQDPVALFERYPARFPLCHVKDRRHDGQQVPVGEGDIDFARIFARAEVAGLRHYFVEEDNPNDPLASIRTGFEYLNRMSL